MRRFILISTCLVLAHAGIDICEYYKLIGKLSEHPECAKQFPTPAPTTEAPKNRFLLEFSSADSVCIQSDGNKCCQIVTAGIPASEINSKSGSCPRPLGISVLQDTTIGCWMDSNCPGIQKCCVEPNPVTNSATRICRDPVGISSTNLCSLPLAVGSCTAPAIRFYYDASSGRCNQFMFSGCGGNANNFQSLASCQATCGHSGVTGTPACPADANAGLNCLFAHADACNSDRDCLGRENTAQPSCCMTSCGYKICYQY
ncbi:unnamed protein product [Caenorhabditis angaria]|uniref:BPTI/Kunitz inhibitor domain-containing protein n=1 Tax=Caenorhabditis angaria TaxID=860376 RepID=A0A9P1J1P7_9PELO|nr:unnamed protein product [Caenorhabditis angaria]